MATTIKLKNGSGAPLAGDLVQGEPAFDLTNKRLYTEDSGGTVIEIGTTPTSLNTTGTVTFGNLSDGTITVTAFVDEDNMASNSATLIPTQQSVKAYVDSQVASVDTLAELTDTNITTPADGALLFYDTGTSKWIDNVVSGDITIADTGVASIEAGVIVNADINASAAIDVSKTALTAGTGLTLTTNTLSVDAAQTQITSVGTLSSLSVSGTLTLGGTAVTSTAAELNYLDITTLGTSEASKAVTADSSAKVTLVGTTSVAEMIEKVDIPTSTTGTINFDFLSQAVQLYNTDQTANRTINFRGDSSNSLNSIMAIGESMTAAVLMKQGSSAYYLNTYQVDGTGVTPEWSGGSAPSSGNANSIDSYVFTIIKTADATFTVLASQSQYA